MDAENGSVYLVTRKEHHWLPTCPCDECVEERRRRSFQTPTKISSIRQLSVRAAALLGFIPSPSLEGSLAKRLSRR